MVDKRDFHQVLGESTSLDVVVVGLGATTQEVERVGVVQTELEDLQDVPLGLEDLFVRVTTVGHVDEVLDRRGHDLLVL